MARRDEDWLRQAKRDLEHARHALEDEDYPNSYPSGAPLDFYTREGAERVIGYAEEIVRFCEDKIFR